MKIVHAAIVVIAFLAQTTWAAESRIVGYFAEWGVYQRKYNVMDIPADKLTHVNYAFAKIVGGECAVCDKYAALEKTFPEADAGEASEAGKARGNFNQLVLLKKRHPRLKTLISIGGWTQSGQFSDVALSSASRAKLARSCLAFMEKYGFDGADIDWEYPGGGGLAGNKSRKEDVANFTLLLADLRREFDAAGLANKRHYLLTIAAPAGAGQIAGLEVAKFQRSLDWLNVMTYDFHGGWDKRTNFNAPLYAVPSEPGGGRGGRKLNADAAIRAYLAAGVPPEKLLLGVPFYGRGWNGVRGENDGLFQPTGAAPHGQWEAREFDYREIAAHYLGRYERHWQDDAKVPWLYDPKSAVMISYDDPQSLKLKAIYAREKKLGGVMIWELGGDDAKQSLITAVHDGLVGK